LHPIPSPGHPPRSRNGRREGEEWQRKCELERERRQQREAEIIRQQQQAAERETSAFSEIQCDVLGAVIAEERKRQRAEIEEAIGSLRAEINVQRAAEKAHESDPVIDLPQGFWKRDAA
jgi:hypothetical protein